MGRIKICTTFAAFAMVAFSDISLIKKSFKAQKL